MFLRFAERRAYEVLAGLLDNILIFHLKRLDSFYTNANDGRSGPQYQHPYGCQPIAVSFGHWCRGERLFSYAASAMKPLEPASMVPLLPLDRDTLACRNEDFLEASQQTPVPGKSGTFTIRGNETSVTVFACDPTRRETLKDDLEKAWFETCQPMLREQAVKQGISVSLLEGTWDDAEEGAGVPYTNVG